MALGLMSASKVEYVILFRPGQGQPSTRVGCWPTMSQAADERRRLEEKLSLEQRNAGWKYTLRKSRSRQFLTDAK